jgi:hypothetical protein
MYLGDGTISRQRSRYRLRIFPNLNQPLIIDECARAIAVVAPPRRIRISPHGRSCVEVGCNWARSPEVFPQHGPGRKHTRKIELHFDQERIVREYPAMFVRGCIQSDGCRHRRVVKGKNHPAYSFENRSEDILQLFAWACDLLEIHWTRACAKRISIAPRNDVARLDQITRLAPEQSA